MRLLIPMSPSERCHPFVLRGRGRQRACLQGTASQPDSGTGQTPAQGKHNI